jgi:hypothetical protein
MGGAYPGRVERSSLKLFIQRHSTIAIQHGENPVLICRIPIEVVSASLSLSHSACSPEFTSPSYCYVLSCCAQTA